MADQTENVVIKVTETGTDDTAAKLANLGVAGDAAGAKVAASLAAAGAAQDAFVNSLAKATQAAQAAAQADDGLASAAGRVTGATQAATGATQANAIAAAEAADKTQFVSAAHVAAASSATAHIASVNSLTNSYSALGSIMKLTALIMSVSIFEKAQDAATTTNNILQRLTKTTGDYDTVYKRLMDTSNATGQSFEVTVKAFQSLRVATAGQGKTNDEIATSIDTISKAMQLSGTSSEHQSRLWRDLTESSAGATLSSRQLVTILAQAPGVMEAITIGAGKTVSQLLAMSSAHKAAGGVIKLANTDITVSEQLRIDSETRHLKVAQDADLKLSLSGTASAKQITAAHKVVKDSLQTLGDTHTRISATIDAATEKNSAAVQKGAKETTDTIDILVKANAPITAQVQSFTLTIAQSFSVLNNNLIAYLNPAHNVVGVNKLISEGIIAIGAALPALIPMVLAFGAAWLVIEAVTILNTIRKAIVELTVYLVTTAIPAVLGFVASFFTLPGLVIAAAAALLVFVIGVDKVKAAIGFAIDYAKTFGTEAVKTFTDAFTDATKTTKAFQDQAGAINGMTAAMGAYANVAGAALAGQGGSSVSTGAQDWTGGPGSNNGPSQTSGGMPLFGGGGTGVSTVPQLSSTGGAIPQLRSGGAITIPGAGPPDTQLVQFMASPGERIIIQTPAQQADKIPHFRSGGQLNITKNQISDAVSLGLTGLNVAYVASGSNSLVGYNAPAPSANAVASVPATTTPTSSATPATAPTNTWTTPDTNSITAPELASIAYYEAIYAARGGNGVTPGSSDDWVNNLAIMERLGDPGGPQEYAYYPFGGTNTGGKSKVNTWTGVLSLNQDGTANRGGQYLTWPTSGAIKSSDTSSLGKAKLNMTPVSSSADNYPFVSGGTSNAQQINNYPFVSSGTSAYARDGLDLTVPGTGAVDSRVLSMAVSPGEQISVKTPAQQRAANDGSGGKSLVQNITIQTTDADSYGRSSKQIMRDLANKIQAAF